MAAVAAEIHGGAVLDNEVRAVGTVAGAVDHVDGAVVYGGVEGAGKAGTVVVGGKAGVNDTDIISAVAAVPLQGILGIVSDSQAGVIEVQLVVGAEIYGVGASGSGAIHDHGGVI